jgi:hypothetical protein
MSVSVDVPGQVYTSSAPLTFEMELPEEADPACLINEVRQHVRLSVEATRVPSKELTPTIVTPQVEG